MPETMIAARFHHHGGPDVLQVEEVPRPEPRRSEVLVRVEVAGMNHLDLWVRRGLPIDIEMPHVGGSDIAGTVVAVGEGAIGVEEGDRVVVNPALGCGRCGACAAGDVPLCRRFRIIGEHTNGGFAEYVAVPASAVHLLPDAMSFETAACLPISYQTAWRALVSRAAVRPGETVLVLGASGGTAQAAVQVARLAGATVFAVTSGQANVERVRALGADVVYDREREDFAERVREDTGRRGVDVVVENVGEATWERSVRSLAPDGRLVTYGATTGATGRIDLRVLFWKQLRLIGSTMASLPEFSDMLRAAFAGRLEPVVDRIYPLAAIREAHEHLEAGHQFGNVLVVPPASSVSATPDAASRSG
jgi:NADPH:quinone reductase-like Zn-dependent oxidoreductase